MKYNTFKVHLNKHNFLHPLQGLGIRTSFDILIENCQKVILIQISSKKSFFFSKTSSQFLLFFFLMESIVYLSIGYIFNGLVHNCD
jgi:hypothetical protein